MKKPDKTVSLLPVFVVLLVALLVFFTPWKLWSSLFSGLMPGKTERNALNESVKVWVSSRSGLYYCADSTLFGKVSPGVYMAQGEALQKGYRPAEEQPCRDK
ncbi:MAG TPA: hypothetical protein VMT20_20015 [Terriglobia bacterium]|nr:hypothetical protein [Terriglobia bacterium]